MGKKNAELVDLIQTTLEDLPHQEFDIAWTSQRFEACRIYQQDRIEIDGGTAISRRVMLDNSGNAHYRRLFDTDSPNISDVMKTITVPWCQISTNYSWDKLEILRNSNNVKGFINLMKSRRDDGLWALAELIEDRFWKTPTNASDDLFPYGVPYYLNMLDAGATTAGFNGQTVRYQDGTTGTVVAGLDAGQEPKWKNYAAVYSQVDNTLLRAFRTAFLYTSFKAPLFINDPSNVENLAKRVYTDFDTTVKLQDLADQRDDNHTGKDLLGNIMMDETGLVYINRLPVVPIPQLNAGTYLPVYCVDFSNFKPVAQQDYWMEESEPMTDRGQHTTFTVYLDGSHNNLVTSRRKVGFVLHKAIPA